MPSEPRWITAEELISINELLVGETGEQHALLDEALLESAAARPINRWYYGEEEDVVRLGVALLYGVVKNHPFEQGNKRTGTVAALMFFEANGYTWSLEDDGDLGHWVTAMTADELSEDGLAEQMRPYVVDRESWGDEGG